jgi:hypothetical protein
LALQPFAISETLPDDSWIQALSDWTKTILDPSWEVYNSKWPTGYRMPAVLWRLNNISVTSLGRATFEVKKQITGHVLCTTSNMQIDGVLWIAQCLGIDVKIPLDISKRRYLTVTNVTSDIKLDSFKAGQISLVLSRFTNKPAVVEDAQQPGIGKITINGGVS